MKKKLKRESFCEVGMFKIFVMIIATNPASRFDEEDVYRGESLKY